MELTLVNAIVRLAVKVTGKACICICCGEDNLRQRV